MAKQFSVTVDLLAKINKIKDKDKIQVGQVLKIPGFYNQTLLAKNLV
ncbi:MAG: LysM peptidoglycan-binding domain-containing protein [Chitinophagaceae bacterium]|nr:LysM peptidoglycan-binding domain-containing protein [Chitinophagaceae bacterium]